MSRTITVKGIGKASAKPDYIILSLTLNAQEQEYEDTMAKAALDLEALRDAVATEEFQREDLKTSSFGI